MKKKAAVKKTTTVTTCVNCTEPEYMPTDIAYYLDKRAKRIVKVEVVEAHTVTTLKPQVPDCKEKEFEVQKFYECKTSIGTTAVLESNMIKTFKEASLKLGMLLID